MPAVVYVGPYSGVFLPDGTRCDKGVSVDVPADVAENLIRQGTFEAAKPVVDSPKPKPPVKSDEKGNA